MNVADGAGWFFLGSLFGWAATILLQWWIKKVSADFCRELKAAMKGKESA